jgi:uncharacterized membrane protein YqjE
MNEADITFADVAAASKRAAQRVIDIGENRLELLMVEVQEARVRLLRSLLVALAMAMFGLLAGFAFTLGVIIVFWERSPVVAIGVLVLLFGGTSIFLRLRLGQLQREWHSVPAILDQLRKDCECLDNHLR